MQIIPTKKLRAKRDGETISVELQKDVSLTLTLEEAIYLFQIVRNQAFKALEETTSREPEDAQVIAFPVHATRRAAQ
ncbi:MAG: hypothetical protein AAGI28_03550 [Pseudomonadota bacterium]